MGVVESSGRAEERRKANLVRVVRLGEVVWVFIVC